MRTNASLAVVLAAFAACSACKKNDEKQPDPQTSCTLGALGASCGIDSQCCSSHCANGICVKPAGECAATAAACGTGSDCCLGSCPAGNCCVNPGGTCTGTPDCCSGDCMNHVCLVDNPRPNGSPCTAKEQCQSAYCNPSTQKCETPQHEEVLIPIENSARIIPHPPPPRQSRWSYGSRVEIAALTPILCKTSASCTGAIKGSD